MMPVFRLLLKYKMDSDSAAIKVSAENAVIEMTILVKRKNTGTVEEYKVLGYATSKEQENGSDTPNDDSQRNC